MSIDIEIIPLLNKQHQWGEVRNSILKNTPDPKSNTLIKGIALFDMVENRNIDDFEVIRHDRGYRIICSNSNTLTFSVIRKDEADDDKDFIEDFGCNLRRNEQINLIEKWKKIPFSYLVSTGANRSEKEVELMGIVCAAFARVSKGVIVISESDFFDIGKGIYKPDDLLNVRMKDGGNSR